MIERPLDTAVFHSLYGQLSFMDKSALDILNKFSNSQALDSVQFTNPSDIKIIQELRDRYFIIPENEDELRWIKENQDYRIKNQHTGYLVRALQIITSNECNFKCKYCFVKSMYVSEERKSFHENPETQNMTIDTAFTAMNKTLDLFRKNKNTLLNVEFFGGEPLMNWPLIKSVLTTYGIKSDGIDIRYSITTNGSLLTDEMAQLFTEYGVTVTLSFDSPKNTQRIVTDKQSALDLILKSLTILNRHNTTVTFNSVISKETIKTFDGQALVDFAIEHQVKQIGVILDLDLEFYQTTENREFAVATILKVWNYGQEKGIPIVGYWYQIFSQIYGEQALNIHSGYKTCPATGCKLSVEPGGHLFICKCCSSYLGHMDQLDKVLNSDLYSQYSLQAYQNAPECSGCMIENFCAGVCMGALEKKYQKINTTETVACEMFKQLTTELIRMTISQPENQLYFQPAYETIPETL